MLSQLLAGLLFLLSPNCDEPYPPHSNFLSEPYEATSRLACAVLYFDDQIPLEKSLLDRLDVDIPTLQQDGLLREFNNTYTLDQATRKEWLGALKTAAKQKDCLSDALSTIFLHVPGDFSAYSENNSWYIWYRKYRCGYMTMAFYEQENLHITALIKHLLSVADHIPAASFEETDELFAGFLSAVNNVFTVQFMLTQKLARPIPSDVVSFSLALLAKLHVGPEQEKTAFGRKANHVYYKMVADLLMMKDGPKEAFPQRPEALQRIVLKYWEGVCASTDDADEKRLCLRNDLIRSDKSEL